MLPSFYAGADELLIEMQQHPEKAISDRQQCLNFYDFSNMIIKGQRDARVVRTSEATWYCRSIPV
jgi:3-deoxy-D-arabino-heptulosonate 7-phosphate (DAHP) synthase